MCGQKTNAGPLLLNVNRKPGQPKKSKKITLVFDENKRRQFLNGFHKRKLQRRQHAQEELKKQLKEERKRIKYEAREQYKKLLSTREVPELQQLLSEKAYETEGHTVSILELNIADLAEGCTMIGENNGIAEDTSEKDEDQENHKYSEYSDAIIGMSLDPTRKDAESKTDKKTSTVQIQTKKDLNKAIKKAALSRVKKSKVFQQKQKMERQKNRKESQRRLRKLKLAQKQSGKHKRKS